MGNLPFDYNYVAKVRYPKGHPNGYLARLLSESADTFNAYLQELEPYGEGLRDVPAHARNASDPFWENGWFSDLDAICLYCMLCKEEPEIYLEIGSGNSTKFARKAIHDNNLQTRILSIDPAPRAEINELCDGVIRLPLEDVGTDFFTKLPSSSMILIDNSHRSFQNSDVTVSFLEILPALPQGALVCFHDICLPDDYPQDWLNRWYNEQYLLASFLLGGHQGYEILLPVYYASQYDNGSGIAALRALALKFGTHPAGGCFGMRKTL